MIRQDGCKLCMQIGQSIRELVIAQVSVFCLRFLPDLVRSGKVTTARDWSRPERDAHCIGHMLQVLFWGIGE